MNRARVLLAAVVVGCMGSSAAAHDTWLQPRRTAVLPGTIAQIDLTSSDKFAAFDTAIKPDRIEAARARLNGKTFDIPPGAPEKKSLELRVALPDPGVAALWLSLAPQSIEMNRKQVQHYLDEIDAPPLPDASLVRGQGAKRNRGARFIPSMRRRSCASAGRKLIALESAGRTGTRNHSGKGSDHIACRR